MVITEDCEGGRGGGGKIDHDLLLFSSSFSSSLRSFLFLLRFIFLIQAAVLVCCCPENKKWMGKLCFHRQNTLGLLYLAKVSVANLWVNGGFVGVLENLKSRRILFWHLPGLESPGKRLQILESPRDLLNSSNKDIRIYVLRNVRRPEGEWILQSWEWKGLRWNLLSWKNQSESWRSPRKVLDICYWKRIRTLITMIKRFSVIVLRYRAANFSCSFHQFPR